MEVRRIAGALGAEISRVDLHSLDDDTVKKIWQALLDNLVVFFRDQDLDPAAFLAFAAHFGKPVEYPFVKGLDGFPEIIQVLKREEERINFGGIWHSDRIWKSRQWGLYWCHERCHLMAETRCSLTRSLHTKLFQTG